MVYMKKTTFNFLLNLQHNSSQYTNCFNSKFYNIITNTTQLFGNQFFNLFILYTLHFVVWSSTQMKYTCMRSVFFVVPKLINNLNELVLAEKLMLMQVTNFCSWNTNKMYFPSSKIYLYFIHENYSWYQSRAGLYFVSMIFKLSFLLRTSTCFSYVQYQNFYDYNAKNFLCKTFYEPYTLHL